MRTYKQGDTIRRAVKLAYKGTGDPVDLSECTAQSQLRTYPAEKLMAEGKVSIDVPHGLVWALYTPEQTAALQPGEYGYDIRMKTQGDVITLLTTRIKICKAYTEME